MPVITPRANAESIRPYNEGAAPSRPKGNRPKFFWHTEGYGVPRYDDLITVRMLQETHTARLPLDTIIKQVTTTPFSIRPTVDDPSSRHWDACDDVRQILEGNYNPNHKSFDYLLKQIVDDMLGIDAGIAELVPDEDGYLKEIYARDGATFTKNPDKHGRLPGPESEDPAYYQFSMPMHTKLYMGQEQRPEEILSRKHQTGMHYSGEPIPFTSSQIVWLEENPRSWQVYGRGRVQTIKRIVEIILNQDLSNKKYFTVNEVPEGIVNVVNANESQIKRFREYWKEEVKGEEHKVPLVGGEVKWLGFRPNPEELEFIQSQKWYNKLVWMVMGLNQAEVGELADIQHAVQREENKMIFRRTTKPLLERVESVLNRFILSKMRPYHRVNGEIELSFDIQNPEIERMKRERQFEDLKNGIRTINDVRQDRGMDPVDWGDYPLPVFSNLASQHVDWVLENIFEEEDPPQAMPGGGMFSTSPESKQSGEGDDNFFTNPDPKDALRNERSQQFPDMKHHVDAVKQSIAKTIEDNLEDMKDDLRSKFPSKDAKLETKLANVADFVGGINLVKPLLSHVLPSMKEAMDDGADHHKRKVEKQIESSLDEPADVQISFDTEDTAAFKRLRQNAGRDMRTVNNTIKQRVNQSLTKVVNEGGNVGDAIDALDEDIEALSQNHSELVARTEIISSSRHGSQALAESTDVIKGKEWISTTDGREREWHGVMNHKIVPKNQSFTVPNVGNEKQPNDYPREAHIVGEDQPFNCRCAQKPVLREDMPDDIKGLNELEGVKAVPLNNRMQEIREEKQKEGENFREMLERHDDNLSRSKAHKKLGISKPTYYSWLAKFDLK